MPSEICDYAAGKVSDISHFNKLKNQFISGEESEEHDFRIGYCHCISKSFLKPGEFFFVILCQDLS